MKFSLLVSVEKHPAHLCNPPPLPPKTTSVSLVESQVGRFYGASFLTAFLLFCSIIKHFKKTMKYYTEKI